MITLRPIHSAGRNLGVESKFGSGVNNECSRKECISVNFHIVLTKQSPCTGGGGGGGVQGGASCTHLSNDIHSNNVFVAEVIRLTLLMINSYINLFFCYQGICNVLTITREL